MRTPYSTPTTAICRGYPRGVSRFASESETTVRRHPGNPSSLPSECRPNSATIWGGVTAAAPAATPFQPWRERPRLWPRARSQTRSDLVVAHATVNRWRGDDRGEVERSATHADRVPGTRSRHHTSTCSGRRKGVKAGWLDSDRRGSCRERGEHPALRPVPFPVPLAWCHVFGFASLRTGFAAAANLRPGPHPL